jgi:hypothetical protein
MYAAAFVGRFDRNKPFRQKFKKTSSHAETCEDVRGAVRGKVAADWYRK